MTVTNPAPDLDAANRRRAGMHTGDLPGFYISPVTLTANIAYLTRFVPPRSMRILSMTYVVETAAALADLVYVGIYDGETATNLTRVATEAAGSASNVAGLRKRTLDTPVTLLADHVYYTYLAAPVSFTGAAPALGFGYSGSSQVGALFGAAPSQVDTGYYGAGGAAPATIALASVVAPYPGTVRIALREDA